MKKLKMMLDQKKAIINDVEASYIRGQRPVGNGTEYYGPSNPSSITTFLDGMNIGSDPSSGTIGGDKYNIYAVLSASGTASKLLVKRQG